MMTLRSISLPAVAAILLAILVAGCATTGYVNPNRNQGGGWQSGGGWENFRAETARNPSTAYIA